MQGGRKYLAVDVAAEVVREQVIVVAAPHGLENRVEQRVATIQVSGRSPEMFNSGRESAKLNT
jgi:hypothetical protein